MSYTYYDLLKAVADRIADTRSGISTGGSSTTLTTSGLLEPTGYFNVGVLFIDGNQPIAVPIQSWDAALQTFTFQDVGTAISSGTTFTATGPKFQLDVLKRSIRQAFHEVGYHMAVNESITTVEGALTYTLPAGCEDARRLEVVDDKGKAKRVTHWMIVNGMIVLNEELEAGKTLRIHYVEMPMMPVALTDAIDPAVNFELLTVAACMNALLWRLYKVGNDEPNTKELLNFYSNKYVEMIHKRPKLLDRDPILARW